MKRISIVVAMWVMVGMSANLLPGQEAVMSTLWDTQTVQMQQHPPTLKIENAGGLVRWSPDGKRFATLGAKAVAIWNIDGQQTLETKFSSYPNALAWSPDGKYIACAGDDLGTFSVIDSVTGEPVPLNFLPIGGERERGIVVHILWSGDYLAVSDQVRGIAVYRWSDKRELLRWRFSQGTWPKVLRMGINGDTVTDMLIQSREAGYHMNFLMPMFEDTPLRYDVYDYITDKHVMLAGDMGWRRDWVFTNANRQNSNGWSKPVTRDRQPFDFCQLSPIGDRVVFTTRQDGRVIICDLHGRQTLERRYCQDYGLSSNGRSGGQVNWPAAISPDGKYIAVTGSQGLKLWKLHE